MPISTPSQITVPFATSGLKNAIPAASNPVTGNAGYDAGFPATNMTPKEAGGIPPFGQDFNGILFDITTAIQYLEAGMQFPYSSAFATAVGGYPLGAIVSRTDRSGFWLNTVANNSVDPEGAGTGWQPADAGATLITMTSSNVTLTLLQAARSLIVLSGTLTANLNLIFPSYAKQWTVSNNCTGSFSVTCKTAAGSGFAIAAGSSTIVYGNAGNIQGIPVQQFTPVQQGGGIGQATNKIYIGYSPSLTKPALTVDSTDYGAIAFESGVAVKKSFVSSPVSITNGGLSTFPHGLGVIPTILTGELICLVAENGWVAGDIQHITLGPDNDDSAVISGFATRKDATNVYCRACVTGPYGVNINTGTTISTPNPANWQLRVRAFA